MTKKLTDEDLDLLSELLALEESDEVKIDEAELEEGLKKLEQELQFEEEKKSIIFGKNLDKKPVPKKKKKKKPAKEKIVMPIEEYAAKFGTLTAAQERAIRDYKSTAFPELFSTSKHDDDVDSKTPLLALTRPAKILSSLLQIEVQGMLEKKKNAN